MSMFQYFSLALLVGLCAGVTVRKSVDSLSQDEILNLRLALRAVQQDNSAKGYSNIASYHGYPAKCSQLACCLHGVPTFPQWHRLYMVQMEQAIREKGASLGIPYWDWTKPMAKIPSFLDDNTFTVNGTTFDNPWSYGTVTIEGKDYHTERLVDTKLWTTDPMPELMEQVLHALEYPSYDQFEVQFEILHNAIHFLVGGNATYSLATLEYSSFDPLFYVHHSNLDRIYSMYEALYRHGGHVPGTVCEKNCEIFDIKGFQQEMAPFNYSTNPFNVTKMNSRPIDATDMTVFDYSFDTIKLNGNTPDDIRKLLEQRKLQDRAFAVFRLHGVKTSANVRIKVCKPSNDCQPAGDFYVLGGQIEMPWQFTRPYYHEITKTVLKMGLQLNEPYSIDFDIFTPAGTTLSKDILPAPYVEYRPVPGKIDPPLKVDAKDDNVVVRKNADRLTPDEMTQLRTALDAVQKDIGRHSYEYIAEFHGAPGLCDKLACCIHGLFSFPHWHRLFVLQLENSMQRFNATLGMPYWDWTKQNATLPDLVRESKYGDNANPFFDAEVKYLHSGARTSREWSEGTQNLDDLKEAIYLALEQDNFCDFEVHFEVAHNLIHALVGGKVPYGLSTLEFSSFDPIFYLHHSFLDKIWSVWMALQEKRNKPYKAHCAQSYMFQSLRPFMDKDTNDDLQTLNYSLPAIAYNWKEMGYSYDFLTFDNMPIHELDRHIAKRAQNPRVFAGVLVQGIKKSAMATIKINKPGGDKMNAGRFAVLGGAIEMSWSFDRLYNYRILATADLSDQYASPEIFVLLTKEPAASIPLKTRDITTRLDITKTLTEAGLNWNDPFEISLEMVDFHNQPLTPSEIPPVQVIYKAPKDDFEVTDDVLERKNAQELSDDEIKSLRDALRKLQDDKGNNGYEKISGFHGFPFMCKDEKSNPLACCLHGMPTFPHWHRLFTVQLEQALKNYGSKLGIPYWDWSGEMTTLPKLFDDKENNPFYSYLINQTKTSTVREVDNVTLNAVNTKGIKLLFLEALNVLEEDNFCDFEIQFELLHNKLHAMMGGTKKYSMATLDYSAFDPIFMILHSSFDRMWVIWQQLQDIRGKYNTSQCVYKFINKPLEPFNNVEVNGFELTRDNSLPSLVSDHRRLGYKFDKYEMNNFKLDSLNSKIKERQKNERVFAGLMLEGQKGSLSIQITTMDNYPLGYFKVLGGLNEMPWHLDRPYKIEITDAFKEGKVSIDEPLKIRIKTDAYDQTFTSEEVKEILVVHKKPEADILIVPMSTNANSPIDKVVVKKGTQVKFVTKDVKFDIIDLGTESTFESCTIPVKTDTVYSFNQVYTLSPGNYYFTPQSRDLCKKGTKINILIEDE